MTPGVFKAFLYHAEFKKIKSNWTVAQTNGYSFLQKWKSGLFTAVVTITMETNNISCIGTFLSQYNFLTEFYQISLKSLPNITQISVHNLWHIWNMFFFSDL